MNLKESMQKNQEAWMAIIGVLFIVQFFIAENTYLPLDIFSFLVIVISITIFVCICFVKMCYDAIIKPRPKYDFYEVVKCRICNYFLIDCTCHPLPCPYCDEVFGFSADWNKHLELFHKELIEKAVNPS